VRDRQGGDGRGEVESLCKRCDRSRQNGVVCDGDSVAMSLRLKKDVGIEVDIKSGNCCGDLGVLLSKASTMN